MKTEVKKWSVFGIVATMVFLFTACDNKQKQETAASNDNTTFTYKINVMGAEKHGKDAAYAYMTKKFNVNFEFIPVSAADWSEKVRIWMAAGDMPDIVWADIQDYNYNEFMRWAKLGLLKPLPEFGTKYPNLKKLSDKMKADDYFKFENRQYAWTGFRDSDFSDNVSTQGFFYRRDWAEKTGLAKDGDTYTWEEFKQLSKAFKDKDPGNNGAGKTIPISGIGGAYPEWSGLLQGNLYWETYYIKDGKYVWGIGQPETLEGIKLVKDLYDEGIVWKDQIIAGANDGMNKFTAGEVGILFEMWSPKKIEKVRGDIQKSHPDIDAEKAIVPIYIKSPNGKVFALGSPDYWSVSMFNKNMSDAKLERLMQVYDWIASDEGRECATKGVKDIDWKEVNGKIEINPKDPSKSNSLITNIVTSRYSYEFEDPTISEASRNAANQMVERQKKDDFEIRDIDYDLYFFVGPNKIKYGTFREQAKSKIKELIVSSKNLEKDWNDWLAEQQPKVQTVLDELNSQLLKKNK